MDQFEHAAQAARSEVSIDPDWLLVDSSDDVDRSLVLWFGNWESSRFLAEALKMVRAQKQASCEPSAAARPALYLEAALLVHCASCVCWVADGAQTFQLIDAADLGVEVSTEERPLSRDDRYEGVANGIADVIVEEWSGSNGLPTSTLVAECPANCAVGSSTAEEDWPCFLRCAHDIQIVESHFEFFDDT